MLYVKHCAKYWEYIAEQNRYDLQWNLYSRRRDESIKLTISQIQLHKYDFINIFIYSNKFHVKKIENAMKN